MLVPKIVTCLRSYTRQQFLADLTAGVVVGVVALPLAMAFAIASGLSPEQGLFTAIVAGFLISALGGSRVQIGGPTGAFVVIVYDIVQRHGVEGLTICTIMAGLMLIGLGLARLGGIIKYIPYTVITGFTSGIALIIFSAQIKDLFGLQTGSLPADFLGKWVVYAEHIGTIDWTVAILSLLSVGIIVFWPKRWQRLPGSVVAMIAATAAVQVFGLQVDTIGSRFGGIPSMLPPLHWPNVTLEKIHELLGPAATVALLAGIESLLSAVVADGMTGFRHRSNMELVATGVANVFSPLFGGLPATGAIARTATNIRNGARTPIAGCVHALTLFAIMVLFGRWASMVPMCSLAAVLVVVSYNMSEWRTFRSLLRAPRSDVVVLLTTFALTVIFDLTLAVQIGMVLSAFLFMKRMADVTRVRKVARDAARTDAIVEEDLVAISAREVPRNTQVYEVHGPFFFGAASKVSEVLNVVQAPPKFLILRMRNVPFIDATGLHILEKVRSNCDKSGTQLILCGVHSQPLKALQRCEFLARLGEENCVPNIDLALQRACKAPQSDVSTPAGNDHPADANVMSMSRPKKKKKKRRRAG
jgi:SulP family sulfate permease